MGADTSELKALAADLRKAASTVEKRASKATRKAATDVMAHAARQAPVDTGNLQSSIVPEQMGPTDVIVGPTAHYGKFVEYGTSRMAAQPYLIPAFELVAPSFEQAIEQLGEQSL